MAQVLLFKPSMKKKKYTRLKDLPATQGQLEAVRSELKSDIMSLGHRMDAFEHRMDAFEHRMDALERRMDGFDAKLAATESKLMAEIEKVRSLCEMILSHVARQTALMEEQNARNKFVMDQYHLVTDRQDRQEKRIEDLESIINNFKQEK